MSAVDGIALGAPSQRSGIHQRLCELNPRTARGGRLSWQPYRAFVCPRRHGSHPRRMRPGLAQYEQDHRTEAACLALGIEHLARHLPRCCTWVSFRRTREPDEESALQNSPGLLMASLRDSQSSRWTSRVDGIYQFPPPHHDVAPIQELIIE